MITTARKQWVWVGLVVIVTLVGLAALLLYDSGPRAALAQGGGYGPPNGTGNFEALQAALENQPDALTVAPLDAASAGADLGGQSDGSGVEVVPISAFHHDGNNANDWLHLFNGGYIRNDSSNAVCFMAPTYPPNGATLTEFRFSLVDDSAASDLVVVLQRINLATGVVDVIAGGSLTGRDNSAATEAFDNTVTPSAVSNAYAYFVTLCLAPDTGPEILFYGARLFYTP